MTRYRRVSSKALNTKIDNTTNNTRIKKNKLEESENDMKKSEKNEQLKTTFLAAFKPKQIEPTPIPLCSGHKIPAVERAVKDPSSIHYIYTSCRATRKPHVTM